MRGSGHPVRLLVLVIVAAAIVTAASIGVPSKQEGGKRVDDLPAVALGQVAVYRLEIFLLVFYGGLLVLVPLYRGLVGGRLPTEISARGAKFAEEAAGSIEATQELVEELDGRLRSVEAGVLRARLDIDRIADERDVELRD